MSPYGRRPARGLRTALTGAPDVGDSMVRPVDRSRSPFVAGSPGSPADPGGSKPRAVDRPGQSIEEERMAHFTCEVVYRGIFQKNLAARVCRGIVLSARKAGRWGIAFGRYGDSPQRNGIPAKDFAIVADTQEELEQNMARYEPKEVDVTICVDDTLGKGVESWAWYGLQPINQLTLPNGTLLMTSLQSAGDLLKDIHRKDAPYNLALIPAKASFSGLWGYQEGHTDARILGALAKIQPSFLSLEAVCQAIKEAEWGSDVKVQSARKAHDRLEMRPVRLTDGNP